MKMSAKEQLFHFLTNYQEKEPEREFSAQELSLELELSRSVISQYLNQLLQENRVIRRSGKPVLWKVNESMKENENATKIKIDVFEQFIGSKGSQKSVVEKCKAAVLYPPKGLNTMITGDSGVGKSYFASLIYQYAKQQDVIQEKAPYYVLNCADYANNVELLSSTLFGHVAGAFTGAQEERTGLLKAADGGFLFLDEVHRLSGENQEKLFTFMDTGKFRPLGENVKDIRSQVHFVFATTEDPHKVLLNTFQRRVPVTVHLNRFDERPFYERIQIIQHLFLEEAKRMKRNLLIDPEVLNILCFHVFSGNIGQLRNNIQVSCAKAFRNQRQQEELKISMLELETRNITKHILGGQTITEPLSLSYVEYEEPAAVQYSYELRLELHQLWMTLLDERVEKGAANLTRYIAKLKGINARYFENQTPETPVKKEIIEEVFATEIQRVIEERFGLKQGNQIAVILSHFIRVDDLSDPLLVNIRQLLFKWVPRSYQIASFFEKDLMKKMNLNTDLFTCILTILLTEIVDESIELHGLMIAHGKDTASSIQKVVNQLCGNYLFDAIDMPIETTAEEISEEAVRLIQEADTSQGFVLLVDMGSLNQLYSSISNYLDGDLLVVNNLTTAIGLDVGLKMMAHTPFRDIAKSASEYEISAQYYEGFSQIPNIIVSCMSGLGISERIQEILEKYFNEEIEALTLDFSNLKQLINENDADYFIKTKCILTTTNFSQEFPIPLLNIYDIWDKEGEAKFYQLLSPWMSKETFQKMLAEFLHFLSLEGVSERLQFLNPKIVLDQVEEILDEYERRYRLNLEGKIKLNLYMHIALMIERLLVDDSEEELVMGQSMEEQSFRKVTKEIFRSIENLYKITINDYEISLLFELFRSINYLN